MEARLCDACKKLIINDETNRLYWGARYFELCLDCKNKLSKIKEEHDEEEKKLYEQREKLEEKYKNKLMEVGIGYGQI